MLKQPLDSAVWTLRPAGDLSLVPQAVRDAVVAARVPGCVHTDLMRAGLIDDPYQGLNAGKTHWIGRTDWAYRCTFDADANLFDHERIDLAFDGLDTVATIELNGQRIAQTQNMHRRYRFDVRPQLKRGANELAITFESPVNYAERMQKQIGRRPYVNGPAGPFNYIRKMACNFGWDWGPALTTSGIWKGVRLEGWSQVMITSVQAFTARDKVLDTDYVEIRVRVEWSASHTAGAMPRLYVESRTGDEAEDCHLFDFEDLESNLETDYSFKGSIDTVGLWWPRGHGVPSLCPINVWIGGRHQTAMSADESTLDSWSCRIGLRTVELDTSPDDIGSQFVLKVNGKPIFCQGFNWIPDDCFLDRACDPTRVRERLQQAVDAGANMIRVWGGGIYETDEFYDICDELGLMVWQDFLFACAMYPEEDPFWSEVEAEARENVARLSSHPSLVLWNGCNENIWAYRDWGWKDSAEVTGRSWGLGYYLDLLPRVMKEVDPSRPYWAASPWSGDPDPDNGIHPNADTHGNMHVWVPWFKEDYSSYRKFAARFCSEFGFQGPATYSSIVGAIGSDKTEALDFGSAQMRNRQRAGDRVRDDGDQRNVKHLLRHFDIPGLQELADALTPIDPRAAVPYCGAEPLSPAKVLPSTVDFDDLHYLLQLNQCRALKLGVEWFRSRQPRCMGTLYWQLNDCWPGSTSWSCIDGDGRKKPLWYATRRFFADRLLTFQPEPDETLSLYVNNDTDSPWRAQLNISRISLTNGTTLAQHSVAVNVNARSTQCIAVDRNVAMPIDATRELLVAGGAAWYFAPDNELNYPKPEFDSDWTGGKLTIIAKSFLRDVCVFVDRLDPNASISDQLVTLLPGDAFTFEIESKIPLTLQQLTSRPVFRCANEFGRR